VFIAVATSLGILCIRPRRLYAARVDASDKENKLTLNPFQRLYFWLFVLSIAVQSLADNLPTNYLLSFATNLGVDSTKTALLVTYLSLSRTVSQVSLRALT
jgi:hypothetical protein